jgi:hypothetical protein
MGGTTGGFDDRFDFILTSENLLNTADITYITDSYQVYGNNGLASCYNRAINSSNCGLPDSEFQFPIRDALHNFSDHLPVTLSLQTDATLLNVDDITFVDDFRLEKTIINSELTIYINSFKLKNEKILIHNTLGKQVKTLQTNTDQRQEFNVSGLENGIYFLSFKNINIKPLKFFIQH